MKKYAILFLLGAICTAQYTYAEKMQNMERPSCTNSGLSYNSAEVGYKVVNGDRVYVRRMATILDPAMDDNGATVDNDNLEVYCVSKKKGDHYGYIVMCLSNEACPWAR